MRIVRPTTLVFIASMAVILGGVVAIVGGQTVPQGGWLGLLPVLIVGGWGLRRPLRRWRASRRVIPEPWRQWLAAHVPFYRTLDAENRLRFERDIQFFVDEQTFEALDGIAEQTENAKFKQILFQIKQDVESGKPFSEALNRHPKLFGPLYVNMIRASEMSGQFSHMLERIAAYLTQQIETRRMVTGAMIYPVAIAIMAVGV